MIGEGFRQVLAAAQGGDEGAFSALWRDANPALLRYLRVLAPELADDVAGDTWVSVVRGLTGFRGDEPDWRAWLFTTARRRMADERRRRSRRREAPLDEAAGGREPAGPDSADLALANLRTRAAITAVASLPPLQAEAIMLRVVAGLDYDTISSLVGRRPGAVRVAAHRGLRRLAGTLAQAGVTQ